MAIIPQKESKRLITTRPGIALTSPDVAGISGRVTQIIGDALQDVAFKFAEAKSIEETTKADTEATRKINELELEASQDPDVWSIPKYQERITKIKEEASTGISIPQARDRFQAEFEKDAIAADFNIRKILRKRQIDSMKASMLENIEALEESYLGAATAAEQMLVEFKRDKVINENVRLGVINKEAAFDFKEKTKKKWQESAIRNAIAVDATLAKEMLLAGDFKDLTADETAKWISTADKKIKKNKKVAEELLLQTQTQNEGDLLTKAINGEMPSDDVIDAQARGEVSLQMAKTAQTIMLSLDNISTRKSDEKAFNKLIKEYLLVGDGDLEALRKLRINIGVAYSAGELTQDDASLIVSRTIDPLTEMESKKKQKNLFAMAVSMFTNWAEVTSPSIETAVFLMTKELINGIKNNKIAEENIEEESLNIIEDAKKVVNPNRSQFKIDDIVDTPAGPRKVVGFDIDGEPLVQRIQ